MSRIGTAILTILTLLASPALAGHGSWLQQHLARREADGRIRLRMVMQKPVTETRVRPVEEAVTREVDGKQVTEVVTRTVQETFVRFASELDARFVDARNIQVFDMNGQKLNLQARPDLLKTEQPVIVWDEPLPAYYRPIFKADALVVVIPVNLLYQAPAPVPPGGLPGGPVAPAAQPRPAAVAPAAPVAPGAAPRPVAPAAATRPPAPPAATKPPAVPALAPPSNPGASTASAEEPSVKLPSGPAPQLSFAQIDDQGTFKLRDISENKSMTKIAVPVLQQGKSVIKEFQVTQKFYNSVSRETNAEMVEVFKTDQRPVSRADAAAALRKETLVLSSISKDIDPYYLLLVKPEALVVTFPQVGHGPGAVPGPFPAGGVQVVPLPPDRAPAAERDPAPEDET